MNKGSHFIGQPAYGQLINLLDRTGILEISRSNGGERYVKNFDVWHHLLIMLYAVIKRFDSLREITDSMFPEARKLAHLGISMMPRRSTLSDANARRSEAIFEKIYRSLYARYKDELSSDSRKNPSSSWINRLQIIDSTTVTLFSNMLFKGVGRHPKTGKKKGGITIVKAVVMLDAAPAKDLVFKIREAIPEKLICVVGATSQGRPSLNVMLSDDMVAEGLNAGKLVREAARLIQGGGGGQPHFAQAGGKNVDGIKAAVDKVVELIKE